MAYAEFRGQTECIMGNSKIENAKETGKSSGRLGLYLLPFTYSNDKKLMIVMMMMIQK